MSMPGTSDFDTASRSDLIARAEALGIERAEVLTRAELVDEIVKRAVADPIERRLARGLLGVARDLVARVVERGLHLPDAAALIRGLQQVTLTPVTPPISTVTLAEIYAGQGHRARALTVLDEVLANEPDHNAARRLREKIATLPDEAIATVAPSEPPPASEATAGPATDPALAAPTATDSDRAGLPPRADISPIIALDVPLSATGSAGPGADEVGGRTTVSAPTLANPIDRVVLVPVDATSVLARWEILQAALDEARSGAEGGRLILRIVAVTPSWNGPTVEVRDIEVNVPTGARWVCDLPSSAVLRAAIGWRSDKGFDPFAVALDVIADDEAALVATPNVGSSDDAAVHAQERAGIEERARHQAERGKSDDGPASFSWGALALAPWDGPDDAPLLSVAAR